MKSFIFIGAGIALAFLAGRYSAPMKTIEKEKIVYTKSANTDEQKKKNRVVRKSEVRLPDGTVTVETIITSNTEASRKTDTEIKQEKETEKEVVNRTGTILQGFVGVTPGNLTGGLDYGGALLFPAIFGLYVGPVVFIRQDFKFGITAGISF